MGEASSSPRSRKEAGASPEGCLAGRTADACAPPEDAARTQLRQGLGYSSKQIISKTSLGQNFVFRKGFLGLSFTLSVWGTRVAPRSDCNGASNERSNDR